MQKQIFNLETFYKEILFQDSDAGEQVHTKLSVALKENCGDTQLLRQLIWVACLARPNMFVEFEGLDLELESEKNGELQSRIHSVKKLLSTAHPDKLEPRPDLVSSGFCLAWENNEYLIYIPSEQEIGVQLPFSDKLRYRWFDPIAGTFQPWNILKSRRPARFCPPFEEETILLIQAPSLSTRTYKIKETKYEEGPL